MQQAYQVGCLALGRDLDRDIPRGARLALRSLCPLRQTLDHRPGAIPFAQYQLYLQEQFDTSTPIGHAMFTIIGTMAQLERDIIRERVKAGLDRARARGIRLGRPVAPATPDEVLVWRFDRFARSVKHLITALEQFRSLNINFISLQEQFDTSTPIGHAMFTIIGAMAQLERDIIRERVKAGLDQARMRGVRLGRPAAPATPEAVRDLTQQGLSVPEIAKQLHCSRSTVKRRLREGVISGGAL